MEKDKLLDLEYLGTPYSSGDCYMRNYRAEIVDMVATELTNQGRANILPY